MGRHRVSLQQAIGFNRKPLGETVPREPFGPAVRFRNLPTTNGNRSEAGEPRFGQVSSPLKNYEYRR